MSVRAYRQIQQPVLAQTSTFNAWRQMGVLDTLLALPCSADFRNDDGVGSIEVSKTEVEALLNGTIEGYDLNDFDLETETQLRSDIQDTAGECITYELY